MTHEKTLKLRSSGKFVEKLNFREENLFRGVLKRINYEAQFRSSLLDVERRMMLRKSKWLTEQAAQTSTFLTAEDVKAFRRLDLKGRLDVASRAPAPNFAAQIRNDYCASKLNADGLLPIGIDPACHFCPLCSGVKQPRARPLTCCNRLRTESLEQPVRRRSTHSAPPVSRTADGKAAVAFWFARLGDHYQCNAHRTTSEIMDPSNCNDLYQSNEVEHFVSRRDSRQPLRVAPLFVIPQKRLVQIENDRMSNILEKAARFMETQKSSPAEPAEETREVKTPIEDD